MNDSVNIELWEGVWESVNLNPAVMIIRNFEGTYRLMIFHMEEYTRQARPAVYDIEEDETGYFIGILSNRQRLDYDPVSDTLNLSSLGDYIRNC